MISIILAAVSLISTPVAPFAEKTQEFETASTVVEDGRIVCGTKALSPYNLDRNLVLSSEGRTLASVRTRFSPANGWDPITMFTSETLSDGWRRDAKFTLKDGTDGVFHQTFRVTDGKAHVISHWDVTKPESLNGQTFDLNIPLGVCAGRKVVLKDAVGHEKVYTFPEEKAWSDGTANMWVNSFFIDKPVSVAFDCEKPENYFGLSFEPGAVTRIIIFRASSEAVLHFAFTKLGVPFDMTVDFGQSVKPSAEDCVLDGINFTKNDDVYVPRWGKRNLLPNPSFENGSRYYQNVLNTQDTRKYIVEGGRTGRYAFEGRLRTFILPVRANNRYTLSFYVRTPNGDGGEVECIIRQYQNNVKTPGLKVFKTEKGNTDWQRFEFSFETDLRGLYIDIGPHWTDKRLIFDDLQLEEGDHATDFECNPYTVEMLTDAPDGYRGDVEATFNARFRVDGPAPQGEIDLEVKDFFGNIVYTAKDTISGTNACCQVPESVISAKGVYRLKATVKPSDSREFTECFRIARYRYADGTAPNRVLHQRAGINAWCQRTQVDMPQLFFDHYRSLGVCGRTKTLADWQGYIPQDIAKAIHERYETNSMISVEWFFVGQIGDVLKKHGIGKDEMPRKVRHYSPEYLAKIEEAAVEVANMAPWNCVWIGFNEVGQQFACTKEGDYAEYAKLCMAVQRGLKKANSNNIFAAYSVCNLDIQGRSEIKNFLQAGLDVDPSFRFDAVDVHPYRPYPEFPNLDNDFQSLFDDLEKLGYGDMLVYGLEGGYFYPIKVAEWNGIAPWQSTLTKDGYSSCQAATYDLGWGERVSAAMLMRYNLQTYKYLPRLKALSSWGIALLDAYNPFATFVATAAETELLGKARGIADLRLGDGARAYFYDDGDGRCIAAVWRFSAPLDHGTEKAGTIDIEWNGKIWPELFDMMANHVSGVSKDNYSTVQPFNCSTQHTLNVEHRTSNSLPPNPVNPVNPVVNDLTPHSSLLTPHSFSLPLSNFPVFLRVPLAEKEALIEAIRNAKIAGIGKREESYAQPVYKIPHVTDKPNWSKVAPMPIDQVKILQRSVKNDVKWGGPDDCSAEYRAAWNEKGLFLRVDVKDDIFCLDHTNAVCVKHGVSQWYSHEAVQVYFDTLADASEKFKQEIIGHDDNDMGYELLPSNEVSCVVYRRLAPDFQYTGGNVEGLMPNVVEPAVICNFQWDENAKMRHYDAFFPSRYLMPARIEAGARIGIGFDVFDRDAPGLSAKQSLHNMPVRLGTGFSAPHAYTLLELQ